MSESFSASSFQSSMELNLIDVGIFNLNFTFLRYEDVLAYIHTLHTVNTYIHALIYFIQDI